MKIKEWVFDATPYFLLFGFFVLVVWVLITGDEEIRRKQAGSPWVEVPTRDLSVRTAYQLVPGGTLWMAWSGDKTSLTFVPEPPK